MAARHPARYEYADTDYGFKWGPAEITRLTSGREGVTIGIRTKRAVVLLTVTPGGFVRIFDGRRTMRLERGQSRGARGSSKASRAHKNTL